MKLKEREEKAYKKFQREARKFRKGLDSNEITVVDVSCLFEPYFPELRKKRNKR